ncbi:MAG: hypothetical protein EBU90_30050, partial [Proteobacteria bacterium]|nr:hypothetical protein [Pseudomonadota bacterium]
KELAGEIEVALVAKEYNLPILKTLREAGAFDINNPPVNIKHTEGKAERRSMFAPKITDVGQQIADFILVLKNGEELCISFKNEKGDTFSNNGLGDLFIEEKSGKIKVNQDSMFFDKVKSFGVNFKLLLKGLNAYATKTPYPIKVISPVVDVDEKHVLHYVRAALGYGYWYVRETAPDVFDIKDFSTKKHLVDYVHKLSVDSIRYPFFMTPTKASKQCSIDLSFTSKGSSEETKLRGEIRHTHGGVAPKEMKFKFA